MLAEVIDLLECPHCRGSLSLTDRVVGCPSGHRFDPARHGQLNLLTRAAGANADTAAMVAAREAFLDSGLYDPIANQIAGAAIGEVAVEAGAGTGFYLSAVLQRLGPTARGIATDLSAYACRRSAKLPCVGAVVADTWAGLPIADKVADTVLAVFAPRNLADFARICAPSGRVLILTPLADHLAEVRRDRGLMQIEDGKHDRLLAEAEPWLEHLDSSELTYRITMTHQQVDLLVAMGPNAFHQSTEPSSGLSQDTVVAVRLDIFRPAQRV